MVPLGFFFGRIGNVINGELCGCLTDEPWGMIFPHVDKLPRHPSSLYQTALEGLAFIYCPVYLFILAQDHRRRFRPVPDRLWRIPLSDRILSQTRHAPGLRRLGLDVDGANFQSADGFRRYYYDDLGLPKKQRPHMKQNFDLMHHVRDNGVHKEDRNGMVSVFGHQISFDLSEGFLTWSV